MAIEELQSGRYRYERVLGSGGMGDVYLMQDTRVSRRVAIKVVRAEDSTEGERGTDAARLFQREARAIAALEHPNILPLYDFGEEARDGMAVTYMVMPYCADGSLEIWLRKQQSAQPYAPQLVACLVEQAAEALQYAHDHEVIHLDVKPSNFLLRRNRKNPQRPTLLLADFGIARNFTTVSNSSRTIRGTPTSMAPEQWSGSPVFASDQYALAVMTYELLAGRPPFTGSMEQLMYQHFTVQAPPPSKFNPRLPAALDSVLQRALAKKPEERFPSIADFASALVEAAQQPAPVVEETDTEDVADYATQAISQEEAEAALSHMLTLVPDLEDETVSAGARAEQVVHTAHADEAPAPAADVLVDVAPPEEIVTDSEEANVEDSPETPLLSLPTPIEPLDEHDLPTIVAQAPAPPQRTEAPLPLSRKKPLRRPGALVFASLFVVLLLIASTIIFYFAHQPGSAAKTNHLTPTAGVRTTTTSQPTVTATPTPSPGLYIAGTYNGSMENETTFQTTRLSIHLTQTQGQGALQGTMTFNPDSSTPQVDQLTGKVDLEGNFSFTVQQAPGQTPLYFYGTVQSNTNLKGNYCSSATNSCGTNEGFFTVGPRFQS